MSFVIERGDEPIPPLTHAKTGDIDTLIIALQQQFFSRDAYPTIEEQAAIIFHKALWLAKANSLDFPAIKKELVVQWIREYIVTAASS